MRLDTGSIAGGVAVMLFGETVTANTVIGALIVVGAGPSTVWHEQRIGPKTWEKQTCRYRRFANSLVAST